VEWVSGQIGVPLEDAIAFEKMAGGTPVSVAIGLVRLGVASGFVGRIGDDPFGRFLTNTLDAEGVDASQASYERRARTALAFRACGDEYGKEALYYHGGSADLLLSPGHVNPSYIRGARAIVYTSWGLMGEPSRSAVLKALVIARTAGLLSVYTPDLHLSLWNAESDARYALGLGLERADVVQVSARELEFMSGTLNPEQGTQALRGDGTRLVVVTQGAQGCAYRTPAGFGQLPGYQVDVVDRAGASAGFTAGLLAGLSARNFSLETEYVEEALNFANAAAALTTTRQGLIPALPSYEQVLGLIGEATRISRR
jgi:fructokinase